VLGVWAAQEATRDVVGARSFLLIMPAALAAAVLGGLGPGLLATGMGAALVGYRFMAPVGSFRVVEAVDAFGLLAFLGMGATFSVVGEAFSRALEREVSASERARDALRVRDEFLSIASHELRNPLTSLGLGLDLLERRVRSMSDDALLERVVNARRQVRALQRLVGDLLDVTRARQGALRVEPVEADLGAVALDAVSRVADVLEAAGCTLRLRIEPDVRGLCDVARLEQVVTNLLWNVARYAAGAPVEVSVSREGDDAVVVARDHGPGIRPGLRGRLFQPYQRGAEHPSGLGLGLFVARSVVEAHGGRLEVEHPDDGGACFRVTLPR
jgi:signal transduction histidine kinase